MRHILTLFAIVLSLCIGGARNSDAAVIFEWEAVCSASCGSVGLEIGDPVSGWFAFEDPAVLPGAKLDRSHLVDFSHTFGNISFTFGQAQAYRFEGTLDNTATGFTHFTFVASEFLYPAGSGISVIVQTSYWGAAPGGGCYSVACDTGVQMLSAAYGYNDFQLVLREVPEPGTLALFGAALAGLVFARRRQAG